MTPKDTAATIDLLAEPRRRVLDALKDGPKSSDEIGCSTGFLDAMMLAGLVEIDPDPWPDEFVPGNPYIARLPGDTGEWPGWRTGGWRPR